VIESVHFPVLAEEVVASLLENNGKKYFDCTFGAGGHVAQLLASASRDIEIIGIDIDTDAVRTGRKRFEGVKNVRVEHGDYGRLGDIVDKYDLRELDGIVADLGQSSDQIQNEAAGMSYKFDAKLDMRYDRTKGETAGELIERLDYGELKRMLKEIGQELNAARIASAITAAKPLRTTGELAAAIAKVTPAYNLNKVLSKVFMVVRVAVNDELKAIDNFLESAPGLLKRGGRLVVISFDSNQDVRVKNKFRTFADPCVCPPALPVCLCKRTPTMKLITLRAVKPSEDEIRINNRSRSARLRVAEKL